MRPQPHNCNGCCSLFWFLLLLLLNFLIKKALGIITESPDRNLSFTGHKLSKTFSYSALLNICEGFSKKKKNGYLYFSTLLWHFNGSMYNGDEAWLQCCVIIQCFHRICLKLPLLMSWLHLGLLHRCQACLRHSGELMVTYRSQRCWHFLQSLAITWVGRHL